MTHPINPNTNLPMSFQVEKIQQMKELQPGQQQSFTNEQVDLENKLKQQRVNQNNKAEQSKIRDQGQKKQATAQNEQEDTTEQKHKDEHKKKKIITGSKGGIIDVKI